MSSDTVVIKVSPELKRWSEGFAMLPGEVAQVALVAWRAQTEAFFADSQRLVHVISGRLRASGRVEVIRMGTSVEGRVVYDVDYAKYEFGRGGTHDALGRAWEDTKRLFEAAMPGIWRATVEGF